LWWCLGRGRRLTLRCFRAGLARDRHRGESALLHSGGSGHAALLRHRPIRPRKNKSKRGAGQEPRCDPMIVSPPHQTFSKTFTRPRRTSRTRWWLTLAAGQKPFPNRGANALSMFKLTAIAAASNRPLQH
jgi:hypothetical protein